MPIPNLNSLSARSKKILIVVLILLGAILVFSYLKSSKPTAPPTEIKERVWKVETLALNSGTYSPQTQLYGSVVSPNQVTAVASVSGVLQSLKVQAGDFVKEGDVLFAFDENDLAIPETQAASDVADLKSQIELEKVNHQANQAKLEQERSILKIKQDAVKRNSRLQAKDLASQSVLDGAKEALTRQEYTLVNAEQVVSQHPMRLSQLEAKLARANQSLKQAQISSKRGRLVAPYDLRVASVTASEGELLSQNKVILSYYPLAALELQAKVSVVKVPDLLKAITNEQALYAQASFLSETFDLPFKRLDGVSDASGLNAFFAIPEAMQSLRIGQLIQVNLIEPEVSDSFLVPYSALYGRDKVFVVEQGRLVSKKIALLGQLNQASKVWALIQGGVKNGDRILITHLPNATTGLKVTEAP